MLKKSCQLLVLFYSIQISACNSTSSGSLSFEDTSGAYNEDRELLRMLKGRQANELPEVRYAFVEDDAALVRASEYMNDMGKLDGLHRRFKISDVEVMGFAFIAESTIYSWIYSHRYDTDDDMRRAAGASVDNEQCISQLEDLVTRAEVLAKERYNSTDVNFYQLMDTWGSSPSGQLLGNFHLEGMYTECRRLRIALTTGRQSPTRYCLLSLRRKSWPQIDKHNLLRFQAGVCIPKACDSSIYKNKVDLLMRLLEQKMSPLDVGQFAPGNLYCLPDDDSPMRSILASPKATATLVLLSGWLALLVYCTYMDQRLSAASASNADPEDAIKVTSARDEQHQRKSVHLKARAKQQQDESIHQKMCKMLSIKRNLAGLFSTGKASSLVDSNEKESVGQKVGDKNEAEIKVVDFSCIEGIKVISMMYIIIGHTLACMTTIMTNERELTSEISLSFYFANMAPAFGVNAFFVITGMITCYMMFKKNRSHKFLTSPVEWIVFFVYRYMRIMPVYALVVLYLKTLAKYTGSGPLWDYATSSLSHRRTCEREPWSYTLLFTGNYLSHASLCIPGGWYLANDLQFALVTPFFLALLYKRPIIGQMLLCLCTVAGTLAGVWTTLGTELSTYRPIAAFAPTTFKVFLSNLGGSYTRPQYRIPAYLIGLLVGYRLYLFEKAKNEFRSRAVESYQRKQRQPHAGAKLRGMALIRPREPDWPRRFKKFAIPFSLVCVAISVATPLFSSKLPFNEMTAHLAVAILMPSQHVMFALAIGFYLSIATTNKGTILSSFLAASYWKPLARLSLCALLVNVEVINYIMQGSSRMHYVSTQFHVALNSFCIVATYLVSIVVCVLFEAPMRAVLNSLLTHVLKRSSTRAKRKDTIKA